MSEFGVEWSASLARGSDEARRAWLAFALEVADEAEDIARRYFRRDVEVSTKPDRTYVTAADTAVERHVRARIAERYPDHGVVGEEYGVEEGQGSARWYIDPIDGTANFVRGVPIFALLLALEVDGELQVGVMAAPAMRERWYAARGLGAWASGGPLAAPGDPPRRLRVSQVARIEDAHVLHGEITSLEDGPAGVGFDALLREAWRVRGIGDFWMYGLLAEGTAEVVIEPDLNAWDLAAPWITIEEAGGRITDWQGERSLVNRTVLATNGVLHEEIIARLHQP